MTRTAVLEHGAFDGERKRIDGDLFPRAIELTQYIAPGVTDRLVYEFRKLLSETEAAYRLDHTERMDLTTDAELEEVARTTQELLEGPAEPSP